jgi:hypothetical protein
MSNRFTFSVPDDTPLFDVLNALVFFGRPVVEVGEVKGGFQVSVMCSAQDVAAYRAYVTRMGWNGAPAVKSVPVENKAPAAQPPAAEKPAKKAVGVFDEYNLDELMGRSAKIISDFIVTHEDELGLNDYQAMLDRELAGKKRSTVIAGLQAHLA